jgi:spore maturation protein CgeB
MKIGFFGSSLVSSYWNGAATYYRGLLKALAGLGHSITFYEPDAFGRQQHRDIADPPWASVVVYEATPDGWHGALTEAVLEADVLVKASGVGVFDAELEQALPEVCPPRTSSIFWDVDAPATLEAIERDPQHHLTRMLPQYDMVLTYGGGDPVVQAYRRLGARVCVPIYNALDSDTHFPDACRSDVAFTLSFLGNRLPDRERRVEEFFLTPASMLPEHQFLLGGAGWDDKPLPQNVRCAGHVGTAGHNSFFCSSRATLNINRDSMARFGFSPPTRVFEAAGTGSCLLTDAWQGIELFLEPGREILIANDGAEVAGIVRGLSASTARKIAAAARRRVLAHHTYAHRAKEVNKLLNGAMLKSEAAA